MPGMNFDPVQTANDLDAAADWFETHRWMQGNNFEYADGTRSMILRRQDEVVACCMWGALILLLDGQPDGVDRRPNVGRAFYRTRGCDIVGFNDTFGRTKAEVISALRRTAADIREDPSRA